MPTDASRSIHEVKSFKSVYFFHGIQQYSPCVWGHCRHGNQSHRHTWPWVPRRLLVHTFPAILTMCLGSLSPWQSVTQTHLALGSTSSVSAHVSPRLHFCLLQGSEEKSRSQVGVHLVDQFQNTREMTRLLTFSKCIICYI